MNMRVKDFLHSRPHLWFIITGFIVLLASMLLYLFYGYHSTIIILWILSMILVGIYFFKNQTEERDRSLFTRKDIVIAAILTTIVCAFYFSVDITHPQKSEIDESDTVAKSLVFSQPGFDIFRPSDFFWFSAPAFSIAGHLASSLGSVDIFNLRLIHVALTILCSFISYFLFRRIFPDRFSASAATLLLAGSHSLFANSHLGHLVNFAILAEVISLLFLLTGLQKRSLFYIFIGSIFAGFGWTVYGTAKIIIAGWLISLTIIAILSKFKVCEKIDFKRIAAATLIGFTMAILPFVIGHLVTLHDNPPTASDKIRNEIFLFSRAREKQIFITDADTWQEAYTYNIINGLTAFNKVNKVNNQEKYAWTHFKPVTFVDPLTGVLLWIGAVSVLLTIIRRKMRMEMVIILIHFLFFLFVFSFLITSAPNYPRLLITLPFVVSLVVFGISNITKILASRIPQLCYRNIISKICLGTMVLIILYININLVSEYIREGGYDHWPIAGTAYWIHNQSKQGPKHFYLYNEETGKHHREVWNTRDWQNLWFSSFTFTDQPFKFKDLTIKEYLRHKERAKELGNADRTQKIWFGRHREPISNTIYQVVDRISRRPNYFYMIKKDDNPDTFPEEFKNIHDWKVWLNLFTVLRQPFKILTPEKFFTEQHSLPATLFISEQDWETLRNQMPVSYNTTVVHHLSSRKDLLIVELSATDDNQYDKTKDSRIVPHTDSP